MKVLITGSKGFVGKNLVEFLKTKQDIEILEYDIDSSTNQLDGFCKNCDVVVNLAGVNRTSNNDDFAKGNFGVISQVVELLKKYNNRAPIIYSSSIQAELDNEYGKSKKMAEEYLFKYSNDFGVKVYVYRFTNLFGKWSKPNYNSVIATFCYNVSRGFPIQINDKNKVLTLSYIDDVLMELYNAINNKPNKIGNYCDVKVKYEKTLGEISSLIYKFKEFRNNLGVINTADDFEKKLYSTYLSFLPKDDFAYNLNKHEDERGSFTEIIKTCSAGQFSVNIVKPGITKGNHWHNTKNEKFLVVKGDALIKFRLPYSNDVIEYKVNGNEMKVVDIPCGYTHNIKNIGLDDMVFFIWCNECYDVNNPDVFFLEV